LRNLINELYINQKAFVIKEVCHECAIGVRVGRRIVNMVSYADDKAVVASSQKGLQELINRLNTVMEKDIKSETH